MPGMLAPGFRPWSRSDVALTFAMWAVMMVGMMLPSVAPVLLLRARVARQATAGGQPYAGLGWFLAGYLLMWWSFSALATLAQYLLARAALLTPMIATRSAALGGVVLVAVGLYQWTGLKAACLAQCHSPLGFLTRLGGFEGGPRSSLAAGLRHGAYCLGCCWALMALLFVGGVMNLAWIAAIAIVVLLEKLVNRGAWVARAAGTVAVLAGLWLIARQNLI